MEDIILKFENVSGKRGKFRLKDINFELKAGYIMGLAGANGAGKTTLIKYILSNNKIYTGTIKIDGEDISKNPTAIKNKIGYVSEDNLFFAERSAIQNATILGRFYENFDMDIFKDMLKKMEVSEFATYKNMSRGEKVKFQMAFAMAHKPEIYLLDEVTAGMDPVFRIDFYKILSEIIKEEEASILMTSHIESEMEFKMDYVGIMEEGKIVRFGESIDVL